METRRRIESKLITKFITNLMIILIWLGYLITLIETIPTSTKLSTALTKKLTSNNSDNDDVINSFASIYELNDGEIITKFRWKNFLAIETRFNNIDLIQITKDNSQIIQFWLSNNELIDCEYTNDNKTIKKFKYEFEKINPNIFKDSKNFKLLDEYKNLQNTTQEQLLPENLKKLTKFQNYEQQCAQLHQKIQKHFQKKTSTSKTKKRRLTRSKRDLLVFPGTNWCGKGSNGKEFEDLGDYSFADRCCRDHDRCKYSIGPFESQYHLFNYRFHYVSHCSCDERFRSCLKVANSGAANLVGKIYFNIVKTKCFMFQMDDMCIERSWWGNCLQTKRRKRAVFRDPLAY